MALVLIVVLTASCTGQAVGTPAAASSTPLPPAPPAAAPTTDPTRAPEPTSTPTPTPAQTATRAPASSLTPTPQPSATRGAVPASGAKTYTSAGLGIRFSYLPEQGGQTIKVLEQSDKIYVYYANAAPAAGQWVQVFRKPVGESLVDAIMRVIMPGHPAQDCQVVKIRQPAGASQDPNNEYAGISVRAVPGESQEAMLPRWRTCPQPYTVVGGIGYFQADTRHPDRFLFLSIGQYYILAGADLPWQATIELQ